MLNYLSPTLISLRSNNNQHYLQEQSQIPAPLASLFAKLSSWISFIFSPFTRVLWKSWWWKLLHFFSFWKSIIRTNLKCAIASVLNTLFSAPIVRHQKKRITEAKQWVHLNFIPLQWNNLLFFSQSSSTKPSKSSFLVYFIFESIATTMSGTKQ